MAWTEILTTDGIVPEVWEAEIMSEYLRQNFWARFTGPMNGMDPDSGSNIVVLKSDLTKAAGDAINIGIRSQLKGGVVTGSNKVKDNEGRIEFYNQRITIDNDNVSARVENVPMTQQRAAFNVLQEARRAIVDARRLRTEDRITTAMSDTSTGRVRGTYLYGSADSNWNATHATAMTNVDNTDDQLKLSDIDICKRKALQTTGSNARVAKIRPFMTKVGQNGGVQEWFVYVGHTLCLRDLTQNDASFRQPHLLIPPMTNKESPLFTGSWFKGGFNGTLIYEWEGLALVSSTIQVAHNFLLGAGACALVWGQYGKFEEERYNYGHDLGFNHHEINNMAKIVYDRNSVSGDSNEDNGVVHHFAAAVAD